MEVYSPLTGAMDYAPVLDYAAGDEPTFILDRVALCVRFHKAYAFAYAPPHTRRILVHRDPRWRVLHGPHRTVGKTLLTWLLDSGPHGAINQAMVALHNKIDSLGASNHAAASLSPPS